MSKQKPLEQYRGELPPTEIAAGMNAARRNARRLLEDAQLLFKEGRYPTACSIAILAIEESSKAFLLRLVATAKNEKGLRNAWRQYRSHLAKNAPWILGKLVAEGARTLDELSEIYDESSDHPEVLDSVKQVGFYTDCFKRGHWSEPNEVIDKETARSLIFMADILNRIEEVSPRSVELWIKHVGSTNSVLGLVAYQKAMLEEGLVKGSLDDFKDFVFGKP